MHYHSSMTTVSSGASVMGCVDLPNKTKWRSLSKFRGSSSATLAPIITPRLPYHSDFFVKDFNLCSLVKANSRERNKGLSPTAVFLLGICPISALVLCDATNVRPLASVAEARCNGSVLVVGIAKCPSKCKSFAHPIESFLQLSSPLEHQGMVSAKYSLSNHQHFLLEIVTFYHLSVQYEHVRQFPKIHKAILCLLVLWFVSLKDGNRLGQ
mmetsp:Transcript_19/g.70  ORF Transcript_19/g.70 Transcript_19/m.70 type:complete len:211 (-) Transcript_19:635-1267(-)